MPADRYDGDYDAVLQSVAKAIAATAKRRQTLEVGAVVGALQDIALAFTQDLIPEHRAALHQAVAEGWTRTSGVQ